MTAPSWNSAYINANAAIYGGTGNNTIYGPSDPVIFNMLAAGSDYVTAAAMAIPSSTGPIPAMTRSTS